MSIANSADLSVEVFGGLNTAQPPADLPAGSSPNNQDVQFKMGSVGARPALGTGALSPDLINKPSINYLKTFTDLQNNHRLLQLDSRGQLWQEYPFGTESAVPISTSGSLFRQGLQAKSCTLFGREWIGLSDGVMGQDIPVQWDGTYLDRVSQVGPGAGTTATDSATAGNISAGVHQLCVLFVTREAYITAPSIITNWTAAGSFKVDLSNIPIGPSNVIARIIAFTAASGATFFYTNGSFGTPNMVINDNTSTTATIDFTDAVLQGGTPIANLFRQVELGEVSGFIGYSSRLCAWGERNRVSNFTNLSFDGGSVNAPTSGNTGAKSPTSSGQSTDGFNFWNNIGNIFALDGVLAAQGLPLNVAPSFGNSSSIRASGFDFSSIPDNASIVGIATTVYASATGVVIDRNVNIGFPSTAANSGDGVNHATGAALAGVITGVAYGGSSDTFGISLTPANLKNGVSGNPFTVFYAVQNTDSINSQNVFVDYISVTVYYTYPTAVPLGWTTSTGGALQSGLFDSCYAITGDGSNGVRGLIYQGAYQDSFGVAIIRPAIAYSIRVRAKALVGAPTHGILHIHISSASLGVDAGLDVPVNSITASTDQWGEWSESVAGLPLATIPADLLFKVWVDSGLDNNGVIGIDNIEVFPTKAPVLDGWRFSYTNNPEAFDGVTGLVQVRAGDGQIPRAAFTIRNNLYLAKEHYMAYTTDDGKDEPALWTVNEVSSTIGIVNPNAVDSTQEWAAFVDHSGVYVIFGTDPVKISQEISEDASNSGKPCWAAVNMAAANVIWLRIDDDHKRILVGVPLNGSSTVNAIFVCDYKFSPDVDAVAAGAGVVFSSFSGKLITHGGARKWTVWNINAPSFTMAERPDGTSHEFVGGMGTGKVYDLLDSNIPYGDDGTAVNGFYDTAGTPTTIDEQMLQLRSHRKLCGALTGRVVGSGGIATAEGVNLIPSTVQTMSASGGLVTVQMDRAHGLTSGQWVYIKGALDNTYNGVWQVIVTSPTAFAYIAATATVSTSGATVEYTFYLTVSTPKRTKTLRGGILDDGYDFERYVNMHGERFYFRVGASNLGVNWQMEKLCPVLQPDPIMPLRGSLT